MDNMNYVDRYVAQVGKLLPEAQRADVEKELRTLIDDMLTESFGEKESYSFEEVETVLNKLGRPEKLAASYSERPSCLIGPELYARYIKILKIVLLVSGVGVFFALCLSGMVDMAKGEELSYSGFAGWFGEALGSAYSAMIGGAFWLTVFFAAVERSPELRKKLNLDAFSIKELPEVSSSTDKIKLGEPISSIVFTSLVLILFNCAPQLIGIWCMGSDRPLTIIPFFDLGKFSAFLPLFNITLVLGILREGLRIISGKHKPWLFAVTTALNAVCIAIMGFLCTRKDIFNTSLAGSAGEWSSEIAGNAFVMRFLESFGVIFFAAVIFALVLDTVSSLVSTVKAMRIRES